MRSTSANNADLPNGRQPSVGLLQQAQTTWRAMLNWPSNSVSSSPPNVPAARKASVLTTENQRTNEPWGDRMNEKPPHCTRIHIQNVNGFSMDSRGGQFDQFCAIHTEIQADISCGQDPAFCTIPPINIGTDPE
jgi:hypothetical protein